MAPNRETAREIWGSELAHAIEAAGITGRQLAEALNYEPSTVSNWINGKRTPHEDDVDEIEKILGTNGYLKRDLKWVRREISPEWSEWRDVEEDASGLQTIQVALVPGLLQTEAYARAVLPSEDNVRERIERRAILNQGALFEALLDESILYRKVGSESIMAEQLNHLIEAAQRDNVIIRFFSFTSGVGAKFTGAFVLATLNNGKQIAGVDGAVRWQIFEEPAEVADMRQIWARFSAEALSARESINLIQKAIQERWEDIT